MKKPDFNRLPRRVREEYSRFAFLRLAGSAAVLCAAVILAFTLDLSALRYPAMAAVMLAALAVAADCVLFGLHRFLLPPWEGKLLSVGAFDRVKSTGTRGQPGRRTMVELTVDRGDAAPYVLSLFRADKIADGGARVNVFQTHAPYKEGDTLLYLRGFRYPARCEIADRDALFEPETVCPYCGEIGPLSRDTCFRCGRTLLK